MTKYGSWLRKSLIFLSLFTGSLSLLSAQIIGIGRPKGRKEVDEHPARINVGQSLALSEEFSRYGSSSYGFTNVYATWDVGVALPKSELGINFALGGQFSDTGDSPSGRKFTLYKSLFNTFSLSYAHQFSRKWDLTISEALAAYPNLNRYSGLGDFQAATGQTPTVLRPNVFKGAGGSSASGSPLAAAGTPSRLAFADLGGLGYGGYYFGGYGYGIGNFMNALEATLTYSIDSRRSLNFTYDNLRYSFGPLGFATNTLTVGYSQQMTPKLTLTGSYVVGRYSFDGEEDPGTPAEEVAAKGLSRPGRVSLEGRVAPRRRVVVGELTDPNHLEIPAPQSPGLTHTILFGFSYSFSPSLAFEVSAGPSITPGDQGTTYGLATTGSVALTKSFRDKSQLSLGYTRYVGASFSRLFTGRDSLEQLELSYRRELSKRLGLGVTVLKFNDPFFGTGTMISSDVDYRFTKKLSGVYTVTYFPPLHSGVAGLGSFGSGLTNSFSVAYPLTRDLSAFVSYYFTVYGTGEGLITEETGAPANRRIYGNSLSVGIMHSLPSLIRIGRMK